MSSHEWLGLEEEDWVEVDALDFDRSSTASSIKSDLIAAYRDDAAWKIQKAARDHAARRAAGPRTAGLDGTVGGDDKDEPEWLRRASAALVEPTNLLSAFDAAAAGSERSPRGRVLRCAALVAVLAAAGAAGGRRATFTPAPTRQIAPLATVPAPLVLLAAPTARPLQLRASAALEARGRQARPSFQSLLELIAGLLLLRVLGKLGPGHGGPKECTPKQEASRADEGLLEPLDAAEPVAGGARSGPASLRPWNNFQRSVGGCGLTQPMISTLWAKAKAAPAAQRPTSADGALMARKWNEFEKVVGGCGLTQPMISTLYAKVNASALPARAGHPEPKLLVCCGVEGAPVLGASTKRCAKPHAGRAGGAL